MQAYIKKFNDFFKNNKICKNCEIPKRSERAKAYVNDLFKDLLNTYNINDNKTSIELGKAIKFNKTITDKYILKYPKYITLLIFWILLFILFFVFLVCFIFKYFCFVPRNIEKKQIYILITISSLCLGIFILSIITYIINNSVEKGFNNMVCSISKIKEHLINGDAYKLGSSWIGVNNINTKIFESIQELQTFFENKINHQKNFEDNIEAINYIISNDLKQNIYYSIESPNPNKKGKILSPIINKLIDANNSNSFFCKIYNAINSFKEIPLNIYKYFENSQKYFDITNLGEKTSKFFNETIKFYDSINITINEEYFRKMKKYIKGFTIARIILFWLTLFLSLFGVLIFVLYMYRKIKLFINFAWILFYIFMLLTLVISFLFGFAGSYSKDLVSGINSYINKNITIKNNEDFIHNISNMVVDKCIRGNGKTYLDPNDIFKLINNYYNFSKLVNNSLHNFNYYYNNVFEVFNYIFNFYQSEIYDIIKTQTLELNESLKELRLYTDASVNGSYLDNNSNIYDAVVTSKKNCPEGYSYLSTSENLKIDGKKYCLIIDEWAELAKINENDVKARYRQISTKFGDDYVNKVTPYLSKYREFMENYNTSINDQLNYNNISFSHFFNNPKITKQILIDLNQNLKNFSQVFENEIIDDEIIEQMADCIFIQRDINKGFHEAYYSFGMKLTVISILHLIIGIFQAALFIIYYLLFANMVRDNKEVEDLTKKIMRLLEN